MDHMATVTGKTLTTRPPPPERRRRPGLLLPTIPFPTVRNLRGLAMAYHVVHEERVRLTSGPQAIHLPSRIRRGIAEWVGRTLRSQYMRKQCFEWVRRVVIDIGLDGNLGDRLL